MNSYIINFSVYTLAMIGFIVLALYIYKKSIYNPTTHRNNQFLNVENMLRISPTKTIYIIKAGNERFLIAGDASTTTMLAKLDEKNIEESITDINNNKISSIKELIEEKIINRG